MPASSFLGVVVLIVKYVLSLVIVQRAVGVVVVLIVRFTRADSFLVS